MPLTVSRSTIPSDATPAELITEHCADIIASPTMAIEASCIQHGSTSVLEHSIRVTAVALILTRRWHIPVDVRALTRGSLLHDYFLYDWHDPEPWHRLHGFRHPYFACKNAIRDFAIGRHEQAIIKTHMFPLVPIPPATREAALLCLADKIVATGETIEGFGERIHSRKEAST